MAGDKPDDKPGHERPATPSLDQRRKEVKINSSSSPVGYSKDLLIAENEQAPQEKDIPDFEHKMSDSVRNYCLMLPEGDMSFKTDRELVEIYIGIRKALIPYPEVRNRFGCVGCKDLETKGKRISIHQIAAI